MSKLTKFTRDFWATAVAYGGSNPIVLRDYDILKDRERGLSCGQIAIKYSISCTMVMKVINKYQ